MATLTTTHSLHVHQGVLTASQARLGCASITQNVAFPPGEESELNVLKTGTLNTPTTSQSHTPVCQVGLSEIHYNNNTHRPI